MTPFVYLRYRATTGDPWIVVPPLILSSPPTPTGAIPVARAEIETGVEFESASNMLVSSDITPTALDNFLALRIESSALINTESNLLLAFLIAYKSAPLHEAKYLGYLTSDFVTASIGRIRLAPKNGSFHVSFRLASQIS
jgi:hypothetical protein